MATIHCDITNGDDTTGDGSSGTPYATLSKAFSVVAAGDVIKIANTGAQSFATLAYPAIVTTSDAWLVIEGWDNGGAQVIENPAGDFTDVGVIEGRITGTLAFVKWKKIKFQNQSIGNNSIVAQNNDTIYEYCDFNGITTVFGNVISLGSRCTLRFCSFRGCITNAANALVGIAGNPNRVLNCYFYDLINGIAAGTQANNVILNSVLDQVSGYGIAVTQGDNVLISGNTIIGDNSTASSSGILMNNTAMEYMQIYNNHIQDFSGSGSIGINASSLTHPTTKGTFDILGNNSFYNNTTNQSLGTNFTDCCMTDLTGDDIQETAEPLVDKAAFDYSKKSTALSYGQTGIPLGFNYTTTNTNKNTGAVENTLTAASSGGYKFNIFTGTFDKEGRPSL